MSGNDQELARGAETFGSRPSKAHSAPRPLGTAATFEAA